MSRAYQYHQPNISGSEAEESDSDIELDLHELDPISTPVLNGSYGDRHASRGSGKRRTERQIPLRNLRDGKSRGLGYMRETAGDHQYGTENEEDLQGFLQQNSLRSETAENSQFREDEAPLLNPGISHDSGSYNSNGLRDRVSSHSWLPDFMSSAESRASSRIEGARDIKDGLTSRNISIGQYPPPRFPPNAVSNAKYTPWSFLPRTLYNEFSFFFNMYFLLVALSQLIPFLRIGYVSTYVVPLACVLAITLGKEALDDVARRRRDGEANKEPYTVLRLRDVSMMPAVRTRKKNNPLLKSRKRRGGIAHKSTRLDAIEEEEENLEGRQMEHISSIEIDEIKIRSRDLKVGDLLKLGKDQRVPADLVVLKSYTVESAVALPVLQSSNRDESLLEVAEDPIETETAASDTAAQSLSSNACTVPTDGGSAGETFIRTDQLDGETDWKLRLASPLTQSLGPRDFARLKIVAGKPDRKVSEFVGTVEYSPSNRLSAARSQHDGEHQKVVTAPLNIDNTAWANTVIASNAIVLAVVIYTGSQTRQALSTTPSRSKTGLLEYEINNLTKILCALTLTLSIVLVALEGFESRPDMKWYVAITRFLILFSTIIPISLRVNLDMGKTVYAWFIERDRGMPGTVVRTSTIPEELGRIEYLLSDKTGTLTQNGKRASIIDR